MRVGSWISLPRLRLALASAAVLLLVGLACVRSAALVSNRYYFGGIPDIATFGSGIELPGFRSGRPSVETSAAFISTAGTHSSGCNNEQRQCGWRALRILHGRAGNRYHINTICFRSKTVSSMVI